MYRYMHRYLSLRGAILHYFSVFKNNISSIQNQVYKFQTRVRSCLIFILIFNIYESFQQVVDVCASLWVLVYRSSFCQTLYDEPSRFDVDHPYQRHLLQNSSPQCFLYLIIESLCFVRQSVCFPCTIPRCSSSQSSH